MTQPLPTPSAVATGVADAAMGETTRAATEASFLSTFGAAVAGWLLAATSAVLGPAGTAPNVNFMPPVTGFVTQAVDGARRALRRVWTTRYQETGVDLRPYIDIYLQKLPYRLDTLDDIAYNRAVAALAEAQRGRADIALLRETLIGVLAPAEFDAYVKRLAQTEAGIAVNGARDAAAGKLFALGADVFKTWRHRHDAQVRPTHREAGGQTVPYGVPFLVGAVPMMHPHDPSAPAAEVVNCRCVAEYKVKGEPWTR